MVHGRRSCARPKVRHLPNPGMPPRSDAILCKGGAPNPRRPQTGTVLVGPQRRMGDRCVSVPRRYIVVFFLQKLGCFLRSVLQVPNPHSFFVLRSSCASFGHTMVFPAAFFVTALFPVVALAANNWTQPCHTGECEWDLPAKQGSGTMRLVSYPSLILVTYMNIFSCFFHSLARTAPSLT